MARSSPWLLRKTLTPIASLDHKPTAALLVIAAHKVHKARDLQLDAVRDPAMWSRFHADLKGIGWYLVRMPQTLTRSLPHSRSMESLGESMLEIPASSPYRGSAGGHRPVDMGGAIRRAPTAP